MSYTTAETADCVTLDPGRAAASVIWLHGLGADGHDFVPMVPELGLPAALRIRFVFPHAGVRPVTINGGYEMRAWYDITSLSAEGRADAAGLAGSVARVTTLIDAERAAGIDAARIVVAGFSQGGAVAIHAALAYPERLAGLLALSTYLPLGAALDGRLAAANRGLPVMMCHGSRDPVVAPALGTAARDWLIERRYPVTWRDYPIEHEVSRPEIGDLSAWLLARLA